MVPESPRPYLSPDAGRQTCRWIVENSLLEAALKLVRGPNILEMGYGDGIWSQRIIERFGHTTIVDGSPDLLEEARKRHGENAAYRCSFFEDYNPPRVYDTVLATYVLEHVDDPILVLKQARKWIKPGGQLIIAVPNAESLHRRLAVAMGLQSIETELGESDRLIGHKRVYTIEAMTADINAAGFRVVYREGHFLKPLPQKYLAELPREVLRGFITLANGLPTKWAADLLFECEAASCVESSRR
jgi:2-polyprenyl-3-methyl-5-hydroxy-6-metoxy-1,4-benzoquinol methylase